MDAAQHDRVKWAHGQALALSESERSRFLEREFGGEPHLQLEVEKLLAWHEEAGGFLCRPMVDSPDAPPVRYLGPYQLVKELGRGGSAIVYLARRADDLYQKDVAIKVFHRLAHSRDFLAFQREIQVLARIENAHIARLLDAGVTPEALAYIVIEYVDGLPISEFAAGLALEQKVRVFLQVCDAVAYAHDHRILHRDLKPSNILVTADGTVRLLDFGISLLLDQDTRLTETGLERMTLQYASPEQIRGDKEITASSDIYSLGVILYELIAGMPRYEGAAYRIPSQILEDDPPNIAQAPRDLNDIVQQALRKAPQGRYPTVHAFRDDLVRFLDGRSVAASRGRAGYRVARFLRRHWIAAAICVLIGILSALSFTQVRFAQQQTDRVKTLLLRGFTEAREAPGSWITLRQRKSVEQTRLAYLESAQSALRADVDIEAQRFSSLRLLGMVAGGPDGLNLGDTEQARRYLESAVQAGERMLLRPQQLVTARDVALTHIELGTVLLEMDASSGAQAQFERADELARMDRTDLATRAGIEVLAQRSRILALRGDNPRALALRREIVDRRRVFFSQKPEEAPWEYAGGLCSLGELLRDMGQPDAAARAYAEALPIVEKLAGNGPVGLEWRWNLAREHREFGKALIAAGQFDSARLHVERAIELNRSIVSVDPDAMSNRRALATSLATLGTLSLRTGDRRGAQKYLREAFDLSSDAVRHDPASAKAARELAEITNLLNRYRSQ